MEKAKFKWHRVLVCTLLTLILLSPMMTFAMEVQGETSPAMLEARTVDSQRLANFNRRKAKSDEDDSEPEPVVPVGETVTVGDRNSQITTEYAESSYKATENESIPVFPGIVESKIIKPVLSVEGFISSQAEEPVITTPMPGIVESRSSHGSASNDSDVLMESYQPMSQEEQMQILTYESKVEIEEDVIVLMFLWYISSELYVFFILINVAAPTPTIRKFVRYFQKEVFLLTLSGLLSCVGVTGYSSIICSFASFFWEVLSK